MGCMWRNPNLFEFPIGGAANFGDQNPSRRKMEITMECETRMTQICIPFFFSREGTVEGKWIRKGFCSKERHSTGKALRGNGMTEINYHTWAFLGRTVYGYGARGEGLANWITIIVIASGVTFNPNPKDWPSVGADNLEQDRFSFDTFTVEV